MEMIGLSMGWGICLEAPWQSASEADSLHCRAHKALTLLMQAAVCTLQIGMDPISNFLL